MNLDQHFDRAAQRRGYHPTIAQDRAGIGARSAFKRATRLEQQYGRRLRSIARHIGELIRGFADVDTLSGFAPLQTALRRYADILDPWARSVGDRMVKEIAAHDATSWRQVSAEMGRNLRSEIETAPTGDVMRAALERQVTLIKSLPLDAAQRVHDLTTEGIIKGTRHDLVAAEIMRTGDVTKARATTIADAGIA